MAPPKQAVAVWGRPIGRSLSVQQMLEATHGEDKQRLRVRHGVSRASEKPEDGSVTLGRFLFALCHLTLAIILATLSFSILSNNEKKHADVDFDLYANQAITEASNALQKGRTVAMTIASFTSEALPYAASYPFAFVPGFERIANDLFKEETPTTMVFAPIVKPSQLEEWEQFAYDYYYNKHLPQPFPSTTGVSSFGRGVWALDPGSTAPDQRYHDLGLNCTYECDKKILTPAFQSNRGPDSILMFNMHSEPNLGLAMEFILDCVAEKSDNTQTPQNVYSSQDESDVSCGGLLPMRMAGQGEGQGPVTSFFQPIRPVKNKTEVTAMIGESTVWLTLFNRIFPEEVVGVDCVLSDKEKSYTFHISNGKVVEHLLGDHHNIEYDADYKYGLLTTDEFFSNSASIYTLEIYPTKQYYERYDTKEPEIALVVSLSIMLFISLSFYIHDSSVRKVTVEKNDFIQARQRFMRFVSHEVRTPLNAAVMGLDVISDAVELLFNSLTAKEYPCEHVEMAKECEETVKEVKMNCQHAADVLTDVLDYDDTERDWWMDVKVIPVWEFLDHVMAENRPVAAEHGLSFNFSVLTPPKWPQQVNADGTTESVALCLFGDVYRLKQVLRNLIGNSAKFTPSGGSISVLAGADVSETEDYDSDEGWKTLILPKNRQKVTARLYGKLRIKIRDTGEKFSLLLQRQLFGKKARFNPDGQLLSGRGGGLSIWISKEIMYRHDGTLNGTSEGRQEGVEFKLILPLYQVKYHVNTQQGEEKPPEPTSQPKSVRQLSGELKSSLTPVKKPTLTTNQLRLLIVDDAASNRKFLRRLLEKQGHTCDEAVNGKEALDVIKDVRGLDRRYDCVLMDYEMPEMDGPTATKLIRSSGDSVFVVGVTGNMASEDVNYFLGCGANVVLGKPLNLKTLRNLWEENGILVKIASEEVTDEDTGS